MGFLKKSTIVSRTWIVALLMLCFTSAWAAPPAAPSKTGAQLFGYWCATCHGRGANMPGTVALEAKYEGHLPAALEDRTELKPEFVRHFVRHGVSIMPFFRKTEISDRELDLIANYLVRRR